MPGRLTNFGTYLGTSLIGAMDVADPDLVMALTDPPPIGLIGASMAKMRRIPFVLVAKDIFPDVAVRLGKLRNRAAIRTFRTLSDRLFDAADRIVSIGRDMTSRLRELGVPTERIITIPDWSDGDVVRPLRGRSALRSRMGWEDRFVVMHSGNVGLSQSLDSMLGAAELLRSERDVVVAVVGEGASKSGLQRLARARGLTNVAFLPYQSKSSLADSLGAADVHFVGLKLGLAGYIVPSKVYGIMAAGKPFIAAVEQGSEPAMIVEEHRCGVRVEPDRPAALADAILRMRSAPLEEMGRRARAAFDQRYTRGSATGAYRRLLEDVASQSR
jgi:glycosyltransferase involved in cell wall biosynthesis